MDVTPPLVTVVMATFNRSNIIGYAIDSVRRQSLADWELLVVGDACTDDTAAVVAAVGDPRIRFWNLTTPAGEQSGPNNAGLAAARGRFVAVLNHDDFWMPGHLARATAALDAAPELDLVYGLNVSLSPDGRARAIGPTPSGRYEAHARIPASGWVFRRELLTRVGMWRPARQLHDVPSQEWLRRASRAGVRMALLPRLAVLSLTSGDRPGSYARRARDEHAALANLMAASPDWEATLLAGLVCQLDLTSHASSSSLAVWPFLQRALKNSARRVLAAIGLPATSTILWLKYRRRGAFIDHLRRVRGLPPLPRA
jgi:glycosyltransferase involved in cell wall biosynthesis